MKTNESFYVMGFARPVDYIIRINVPFNYDAPDPSLDPKGFNMANRDWIDTLNHELVHYYQFMGTAVGRKIVYLQRFIYGWQYQLLTHLPKEVYMPILKWIGFGEIDIPFEQMDHFIEINKPFLLDKKIQVLSRQLSDYYEELSEICRPWDNTIFKIFLNNKCKTIPIEFFLNEQPIKLDVQNSCFEFKLPTGEIFHGDISGYQILESMAKIIQIEKDGNFNNDHIVFQCTNMLQLQYNFAMLYMLQKGIFDYPGWVALLYYYLVCISQICLMMNQTTLSLHGVDKYKSFLDKMVPGNLFLECLEREDLLDSFAGIVHANILCDVFNKSLEEQGKNLKNLKKSWLEICDSICEMLKVPPYTAMLQFTIEEAIEDKRCATDKEYIKNKETQKKEQLRSAGIVLNNELPLAESRGMQFDIGINILKMLQNNPEFLINPLDNMSAAKIPTPPILTVDGIMPFPREYEKIWESSLRRGSIGLNHIINKMFTDTNLACYSSWDGHDIILPCNDFNICRERAKTDIIGFCTNDKWIKHVKNVLNHFGIKKISHL